MPRQNRNFCSTLSPFRQGGRRERKRRLGERARPRDLRQRQKASVRGRGERLRPSCRRRRTKEAAHCKHLTRAQTTWHYAVDAAVPTPQRSVPPARGEGEGNLSRTRKRAHPSVRFGKKPSPLHPPFATFLESIHCEAKMVNISPAEPSHHCRFLEERLCKRAHFQLAIHLETH